VLVRGHLRSRRCRAAFARAARAEGSFRTAFVEHAYIEPEAGHADPGDGRHDHLACTQAPVHGPRGDRARARRGGGAVRIVPTACGGGFGGKLDVSVQPLLAVAARKANRPVRMVYSRTESMAAPPSAIPPILRARMAADAEGRFTAFALDGDFNTGAYASWGPTVANRVPVHASGPYRVPHVLNRTRAVYTNDTPAGAFRGFGVPQAAIATEALVDDLASARLDRWEIRRRNALGKGDVTPSGQVLHASAGLPQCLDALKPEWDAMLARVAAHNATQPRHRLGAGIACMWYGCGNTSMSNPSTMRISAGARRHAHAVQRRGGYRPGQHDGDRADRADALGLPLAALRFVVGDTALTPMRARPPPPARPSSAAARRRMRRRRCARASSRWPMRARMRRSRWTARG
jgi:aldehyde oxidoreductase